MASEGQNKAPETTTAGPTVAAAYGNSDWAAMQAYYGGAMAASSPHPYVWPGQPMMSPYGTPVPFSPYHPGYYAHLPMGVSMAYAPGEGEEKEKEKEKGKKKSKGISVNTPEKSKGSSGSGNNSSRSDSGSEDSSETRDDGAVLKHTSATKKQKIGNSGESSSQTMTLYNNSNTPESTYKPKSRSATKLPISAPGRTAVATPLANNLNMGMDLWNTTHTNALAFNSRPNEIPSRPNDERDLKRERRKQSNRESARRSRLRKQQECEELGKQVAELSNENNALKTDLDQLRKSCEEMEALNKQLMDDMVQTHGSGVLTTLGLNTCALNNVKSHENNEADINSNAIIASGTGNNTESASR